MVAVKLAEFKQFCAIPFARHDIPNYTCLGLVRRRIDDEISEDSSLNLHFVVAARSISKQMRNALARSAHEGWLENRSLISFSVESGRPE